MIEEIKEEVGLVETRGYVDSSDYIRHVRYLIGEVERLHCKDCNNEGRFETGIEHKGVKETKFCSCPAGEKASYSHRLLNNIWDNERKIEELQKALEQSVKLLNNTVMAMVVKGDHESAKALTAHIEALERTNP